MQAGADMHTNLCTSTPRRTVAVGTYHNVASIVDVQWHPLSPAHVCVLNSDAYLRCDRAATCHAHTHRMYCVAGPLSDPDRAEVEVHARAAQRRSVDAIEGCEARILARVMAADGPCVAFCFGPQQSWHRFAVLFLFASGAIKRCCPLVPKKWSASVAPVHSHAVDAASSPPRCWMTSRPRRRTAPRRRPDSRVSVMCIAPHCMSCKQCHVVPMGELCVELSPPTAAAFKLKCLVRVLCVSP